MSADAVEVVQTIRKVVNQEPTLRMIGIKCTEVVSKRARREREERYAVRELYLELSKYYQPAVGIWTRAELLSKGKHGHIQCTGGIPLIHSLVSVGGFREFPWSPTNSGRVGA
jgi:hypothetical protein